MSDAPPLPRFNLLHALWTAGQRLRQRGLPLIAIAVALVGLPTVLVMAAYAEPPSWGLVAVTLSGLVLSGLADGTMAWLALAGGDDPWEVTAEGLGRTFHRLAALPGLVLLLNLPSLIVTCLILLTRSHVLPEVLDRWGWWGLSMFSWAFPGIVRALVAPVVGVLMFEDAPLRSALAQALRMTRDSRGKLLVLELARILLLSGIGLGISQLPALLGEAVLWGLTAFADALVAALMAAVVNQAYFQLHAAAD